ncbi:MAG: hypothetical protein MZV65_21280 [Chromatiales bacterium]|nr:hypothetical protein [Chromatiales bacterium]
MPQGAHAVVLLIGCETALAGISYQNFAVRFHWEGAVVVVSTIAKILGRQGAPLAAESCRRARSGDRAQAVRRSSPERTLPPDAQGTPMVLALTALGDADWDVVGVG